ncbi:acetyltransferase [Sulfitobacter donghicola DSW-25 = KCTC 12864 = JCM 14565]|uniref:Acetyltransferase n=1 Tax=Sulfitobacter donghicola DSW-25 = KCTC 12864 = JCM 14565 TaxID=1300350 RepID=A0A073IGY0_9RHOB|nr:acetyltransferase [Sulfitobacter donghicola DSW-25 = KCTC 12864 = JCM 14565]
MEIRPATSPADLEAVRKLCWDYRTHLASVSPIEAELTETFYPVPKYTALMDALEHTHARPNGIILIATLDGAPVGCAMTHALDPETSEIKRLFVAPQARGHGAARKLIHALMDQARSDGFKRIVLDTSVNLAPARALYASLGFSERGPYQDVPEIALPHLFFFEAPLSPNNQETP